MVIAKQTRTGNCLLDHSNVNSLSFGLSVILGIKIFLLVNSPPRMLHSSGQFLCALCQICIKQVSYLNIYKIGKWHTPMLNKAISVLVLFCFSFYAIYVTNTVTLLIAGKFQKGVCWSPTRC